MTEGLVSYEIVLMRWVVDVGAARLRAVTTTRAPSLVGRAWTYAAPPKSVSLRVETGPCATSTVKTSWPCGGGSGGSQLGWTKSWLDDQKTRLPSGVIDSAPGSWPTAIA